MTPARHHQGLSCSTDSIINGENTKGLWNKKARDLSSVFCPDLYYFSSISVEVRTLGFLQLISSLSLQDIMVNYLQERLERRINCETQGRRQNTISSIECWIILWLVIYIYKDTNARDQPERIIPNIQCLIHCVSPFPLVSSSSCFIQETTGGDQRKR